MTCDKESYLTERAAQRALSRMRTQKPGHKGRAKGKRPMRSYHCPICTQWHLTSSVRDHRRQGESA